MALRVPWGSLWLVCSSLLLGFSPDSVDWLGKVLILHLVEVFSSELVPVVNDAIKCYIETGCCLSDLILKPCEASRKARQPIALRRMLFHMPEMI